MAPAEPVTTGRTPREGHGGRCQPLALPTPPDPLGSQEPACPPPTQGAIPSQALAGSVRAPRAICMKGFVPHACPVVGRVWLALPRVSQLLCSAVPPAPGAQPQLLPAQTGCTWRGCQARGAAVATSTWMPSPGWPQQSKPVPAAVGWHHEPGR